MKYQVVCRTDGTVEIHSRACREFPWEDYFSDGMVDAPNPFGAAILTLEGDERAAMVDALYFPCLAPGYEPAEEGSRRGRRPTRRNVPFDVEEDLDEAVIAACVGRKVTWVSSVSGREEYGVLYPEGPHEKTLGKGVSITTFPHNHTHISVTPGGRRVLNFIHRGDRQLDTQFRAVALDSIVSVTR